MGGAGNAKIPPAGGGGPLPLGFACWVVQVAGGLVELAGVIHRIPAVLAMYVLPVGHEVVNVILLCPTFVTHKFAFGCLGVTEVALIPVPAAGCGGEEF